MFVVFLLFRGAYYGEGGGCEGVRGVGLAVGGERSGAGGDEEGACCHCASEHFI